MIDTKALRSRVLDLAIQGKLTEQLAEDGTADELYAEIQAEKQRLIQEGKLKKEKPLPEIKPAEVPFEIPKNWKWVRLGNIGNWSAGSTPSRHNPDYYKGEIPWLKTGELNDGYVDKVSEYITEKALSECSLRLNPAGSVLIAMYGATIGKLGILNISATTNQACCACIPYEGIDNLFLFYFLLCERSRFINKGHGGAQPNISKEIIINSMIALPPLAEQKRIVARVEEIFRLLDTIDAAQEQYAADAESLKAKLITLGIQGKLTEQLAEDGTAEELYQQIQAEKQRLIKEGKIKKEKPLPEIKPEEVPFEIPGNWKWCRLGQLVTIRGGKRLPAGRSLLTEPNDHIYVRVTDMQNGTILDNDLRYVPDDIYPSISRYIIEENDIYIVIVGSTIGKTGTVPKKFSGMCLTENAVRLTPILSETEYLYRIASSAFAQRQFYDKTHQTGQPKLAINRLETALIPLPPLAEQKRIADRLEELLGALA